MTQPCQIADGVSFCLVAAPVQFDERPASPGRGPEFNEHGDDILGEFGLELRRRPAGKQIDDQPDHHWRITEVDQ